MSIMQIRCMLAECMLNELAAAWLGTKDWHRWSQMGLFSRFVRLMAHLHIFGRKRQPLAGGLCHLPPRSGFCGVQLPRYLELHAVKPIRYFFVRMDAFYPMEREGMAASGMVTSSLCRLHGPSMFLPTER